LRIAGVRSKISVHRVRRYLPILLIAAVFVVAIGAGVMLFRYRTQSSPAPPPSTPTASFTPIAPSPSAATSPPNSPSTPSTTSPPTLPATPATLTYGRPGAEPVHLRGDPHAPVVLEEFGDFECLPCSLISPVLEKLEHDYGNQLALVFREHPLKMHRYALDAARAAEAAGLQGRFWEMHDSLYRNRATWVPADYVRPYLNDYATELRLDVDRFKTDMDGEEVAKRIAADQDRGESLGIDRTPVLFVNGQKIPVTERNEKGLRDAIDKALTAGPH
jgi:protein-disulfide isomerase